MINPITVIRSAWKLAENFFATKVYKEQLEKCEGEKKEISRKYEKAMSAKRIRKLKKGG